MATAVGGFGFGGDGTRRGRRGNGLGPRPSGRQRCLGFHELGPRDLESQLGARIGCPHRRPQQEVGIRVEAEPIEHRPLGRLRFVESTARGVASEALAGAVVGLERRLVGGLERCSVFRVEPGGVRGASRLLDFAPGGDHALVGGGEVLGPSLALGLPGVADVLDLVFDLDVDGLDRPPPR